MKLMKIRFAAALATVGISLLTMTFKVAFADSFTIDVSDNNVAVQADNASITDLLQELEKLTGIPVKFVAETQERVTLDLGLTPIETAISKITPNHMIVRAEEDGVDVIKEVIIIPADSDLASGSAGSAFLPTGDPAPEIEQPPAPDGTNPQAPPTNSPQPLQPPRRTDSPTTMVPAADGGQVN